MPDFLSVMSRIRDGAAAVECSEALREVVAACAETLKPGSLTITISVSPGGNGKVWIADKIGSAPPKAEKTRTLFFVDENDNLVRTPPHQTALGLETDR